MFASMIGVTAELCNKVIKHSHDWCNLFIDSDSLVGGSVYQLTGNPDIDHAEPDIEEDEQAEADPFGGEAVESDDEDE